MNTEKVLKNVVLAIALAMVTVFAALIGGTMLYYLYPHIHAVFPSAANNNIIAHTLSWWDSVCFIWIVGVVFNKPNYNKKDEEN